MASATVLRVKRRLEDNPQDALVLMCKRKKTDTEEISPSLFVFRGTVENQEASQIKSVVPKIDIKLQSTPNVKDIIEKLRKERKEQSSINRYEVINCSRGLDPTDVDNQIDLVDLQKTNDKENDVQYAYDLYISAKRDFDVSMLDNLVSIEHYEADLVLGTNNKADSSDEADEDDDSNDENNWRNEYPDSEKSSINEDDMVRAMERVDLEDLSSEEGDIFDGPCPTDDVTRYGASYAKYKVRVMAENPELSSYGSGLVHVSNVKDMDEESVDGYREDSDDGFYYGQEQDRKQFRDQYAIASDDSDAYSPD